MTQAIPRFSLIMLCYIVAAIAGYFALVAVANRNDTSIVTWVSNTLGMLYGTALYITGLSAFYVACGTSWQSTKPSETAAAIPFVYLPALIGLIGLLHGYVKVFQIMSLSGTYPKPSDLYYAHAMVLVRPLVGLCLTFISFAILSVAMVIKAKNLREHPTPDDPT